MSKLWINLKRTLSCSGKLQKQHPSLSNVFIALVLVAAICASLLVATPVRAINVVLTVPSTTERGSNMTITAEVNIEEGEALPITDIRLDITGTETAYVVFSSSFSPATSLRFCSKPKNPIFLITSLKIETTTR